MKCFIVIILYASLFNKVESIYKMYCDPDKNREIGNLTIHSFVESGNIEAINGFKGNVDSDRVLCGTALMMAAELGKKQIVELLVHKGANVSGWGHQRMTPLHYAARDGHTEIVDFLIHQGVDIDAVDDDSKTSLILAAEEGRYENHSWPVYEQRMEGRKATVELLIKSGADINFRGGGGNTALNFAAQEGKNRNTNLNISHSLKMYCVSAGHEDIVRVLLDNGADHTSRNDDGKTAKNEAIERNYFKIADMFPRVSQDACAFYSKFNEIENVTFLIDERIIDGVLAEFGEFPWMAALAYIDFTALKIAFSCGGTLISDSFILTAAHCAKDNRRPERVRLGAIDLSHYGPGDLLRIKNIIKHPEYSLRYKKNDIALIELLKRVKLSESIKPACLRLDEEDVDPNIDLIVTGWGLTSLFSRTKSDILLQTNLKTMPKLECNASLLEFSRGKNIPSIRNGISETQYCAYDPEGKKDSCEGDSGGPLQIIRNGTDPAIIVGVVSFNGAGTCGSKIPSIYTRVASYIPWIESIVWPNDTFTPPEVNKD